MAVTGSIALSPSTIVTGQTATATVTISNSAASSLVLTALTPKVTPQNQTVQSVAVGVGRPPVGGAFSSIIPATGTTLLVSFGVTPFAPTTDADFAEPAPRIYTVGATIYTNDGQVVTATPADLTVNEPIDV